MRRSRSAWPVLTRGVVAALLVAASSGCAVIELEPDATEPGALDDETFEDEVPEVPDPAEGTSVPLEVNGGSFEGALPFVPVTIDGEGPFSFVLDTGASATVIDAALADELGLPETRLEGEVTGVTGETVGTGVEVESWQLGDLELDGLTIVALDLGRGDEAGIGFDGLLGSDVLSGFGTVTLDYDQGVLILVD